jgi:hypothetical protein
MIERGVPASPYIVREAGLQVGSERVLVEYVSESSIQCGTCIAS